MSKIKLLLLIGLFFSTKLAAQNRFSFGVNLHPNLSEQVFAKFKLSSSGSDIKLSYTAGILAGYRISKATDINLAFNFVNNGYAIRGFQLANYNGTVLGKGVDYSENSALEATLDVGFHLFTKKQIRVSLSSGTGARLYLNNKMRAVLRYDDGLVIRSVLVFNETEYLRRFNIPLRLGLKLERPLNKHSTLFVQPLVVFDVLPCYNSNYYDNTAHLISYGLNIGYVWQ